MNDTAPIIDIQQVVKDHGGAVPLRIQSLVVQPGDRVVLAGLGRAAAETFVHLVTGAALPDEGRVLVAGADTRTIATDTEWLMSLDRFGFVTPRAVLLESLSVAANLALPMTLAIDPMTPEMRGQVEALAASVELAPAVLDEPVTRIDPLGRARLHLARALAVSPTLLLLEQATAQIPESADRALFWRTIRRAADARGLGWLALAEDREARESGGVELRVDQTTGRVARERTWWPWTRSRR